MSQLDLLDFLLEFFLILSGLVLHFPLVSPEFVSLPFDFSESFLSFTIVISKVLRDLKPVLGFLLEFSDS